MAQELADQVESGTVANDTIPQPEPQIAIEAPEAPPADRSAPKEAKKPSLRDQLKASFEEARKDEKGRLHSTKDGKFVPKVEPKEAAPKEAAPVEIQPKQEAPPAQESKPVAGPPPGWSVESKALYASLPDPIKQDILKREGEVSKGFKEYSDKTKRHDEIEQVLAPVRPFLQQIGVQNDAEAIRRLLQWENRIRSNPAQAIPELARQYGVDLSQTAQSNPVPPELKPVVDQFGNIANDVQYLKSELQRRDQTAAAESLAQFAKDKPHFESVKTDMGYMMQTAANAGRSLSLDDAYQQAIWAKPEIREQLIKEQIAKESKPTPIQKAQHARATAVSPSIRAPSAPQVNGAKKGTGVRGSLLDAVRELQDRERA